MTKHTDAARGSESHLQQLEVFHVGNCMLLAARLLDRNHSEWSTLGLCASSTAGAQGRLEGLGMAAAPGSQEANELQKVCAKIEKLEEELEAGKGDEELKRYLAKRLAALEEQKTLLLRQSSVTLLLSLAALTLDDYIGSGTEGVARRQYFTKRVQLVDEVLTLTTRRDSACSKHLRCRAR